VTLSIDKIKKDLRKVQTRIKIVKLLLEKSKRELEELQQALDKGDETWLLYLIKNFGKLNVITQLEYGALTYEEFLDEMVRLGWDQQDVKELLEEEDEWLQRDRKNFI